MKHRSGCPCPSSLAHKLAYRLSQVRKEGLLPYLRPDGKAQVTVEYDDGMPARVDAVVLSTQHGPEVEMETAAPRPAGACGAARPSRPSLLDADTKYYINPTGRFVTGGPAADSGLTGRKIIVDTYGGYARHGGGAFSGKDPTKVDRSAAYMARYVAKNIVEAGLAEKVRIAAQLCHRRGPPGLGNGGDFWDRNCAGRDHRTSGASMLRPAPHRHHPAFGSAPPHFPQDSGLWPFWPARSGFHLGKV